MEVVEIVSAITAAENVNLIFVRVSSMHVARAGWFACKFIIEPFELLNV
jgi:hypothetical protein